MFQPPKLNTYGDFNPFFQHLQPQGSSPLPPPPHQISAQCPHSNLRERLQRDGPGGQGVLGLDQRVAGDHIRLQGISLGWDDGTLKHAQTCEPRCVI